MALAVSVASAALWAGGGARAGQLFWDGGDAPFPPANGGSGTWDEFAPNWATDSSGFGYTSWDNNNPSDAVFDVNAGTVTINSFDNITATSLQFNVTGYTVTGNGSLTLSGAGTIGVANASTATINNRIAGNVGLSKVGAGTLILNGANTWNGATNVTAGTLLLGGAGALASGNALSLSGGLLNAGSITTSVSALSLNGGTITGTGTVNTSGTMSFTGAGPVTMAGNAQIGVPMLFSNDVVFDEATGGNGTINSVIDAPGKTFTKQGAGTLNMNIVATNTFSTTTVNSGTLAIVVDRNFGGALTSPTPNAVTLNGGAIRATSNSTWIPDNNRGWFIDTAGGTLDASFSSGTVVFGATITGPGQFTKTGITTVAVTNTGNTFSGGLLVNQGRWNVQATGSSGTGPITLAPIGTSSVNFGIGLATAGGITPVLSNNFTLTPGTGTVSFEINNGTTTANVMTVNGQISGTSDLVKGRVAGTTGVLAITNPANNYTGATQVLLGTLRTGANNAGLPATSNLLLTGGSIYETSGSFTRALGTGAGQVQLGTGSAGFSAFGGPLTVDIGGNGTGTGPQLVWGAANFNPANTLILNGATANDTLTFRNPIDMSATNRTLQANAGTAIASGVISGTAGLTKGGAGVLQLAANNNFSGGFTVSAGTLAISSDANLGAASNTGTLAGAGTLKMLAPVTSTRNITVNAGAGNIDTDTFDSSFGQITGAGTLTKLGSANLTVSTLRNQALTVQAGKVSIAAGRSTANTSNIKLLTITPGATLNMNDQDMVIDYTGTSPLPVVQAALTTGFAGGSWTGPGINSANAAAASGSTHKTAVGYGEASTVFSSFPATFSGQTAVDNTSVLLRYTYAGDANLDGTVDTLDFNALAGNFGGTGKVWTQADFNFDGVVDTLDFNNLAANFGQTLPGSGGSSGPASVGPLVPEPTCLGLLTLAACGLAARRRKSAIHRRAAE